MVDELLLEKGLSKRETYNSLVPQIEALLGGEDDLVANMANVAAAIYTALDYFWVGFYIVKGDQMVLGPFQGPIACTRIDKGKGVCGKVWQLAKPLIVPDVCQFPGHIACNSASKSEIVIPGLARDRKVKFVLDVDSTELDAFDKTDEEYLTKITSFLD